VVLCANNLFVQCTKLTYHWQTPCSIDWICHLKERIVSFSNQPKSNVYPNKRLNSNNKVFVFINKIFVFNNKIFVFKNKIFVFNNKVFVFKNLNQTQWHLLTHNKSKSQNLKFIKSTDILQAQNQKATCETKTNQNLKNMKQNRPLFLFWGFYWLFGFVLFGFYLVCGVVFVLIGFVDLFVFCWIVDWLFLFFRFVCLIRFEHGLECYIFLL